MKLNEMLERLDYTLVQGNPELEIRALVYDSRKVSEGSLFVCMKGTSFDGHAYLPQAAAAGAAAVVIEEDVDLSFDGAQNLTVVKVNDTRHALALLSAAWFGYPTETLKVIGITGTKGKTTTSHMVKAILEHAGHKVGLIGTNGVSIGDTHELLSNTTPESYALQSYFAKMLAEGCDLAVIEASSQGFKMHRTDGILFEAGVFTNLEPDHIGPGEHETFEEYLSCKAQLFRQCRHGYVNLDDPHVQQITEGHTCDLKTFGFAPEADLRASNEQLTSGDGFLGISFDLSGPVRCRMELDLPGRFSIYNALSACAVCSHFGVTAEDMHTALKDIKVKGRIEPISGPNGSTLIIDYAHNAMSLESILKTLREYQPGRLISLFGCGGNRSKLRRYEMGEVSGKLADLTIITSDNPRFEEPQDIINDIKTGIGKTDGQYVEIIDRREAIQYAADHAKAGDIILIAGKGHEDYQEIRGVKYPMDDRTMVLEAIGSAG